MTGSRSARWMCTRTRSKPEVDADAGTERDAFFTTIALDQQAAFTHTSWPPPRAQRRAQNGAPALTGAVRRDAAAAKADLRKAEGAVSSGSGRTRLTIKWVAIEAAPRDLQSGVDCF